MERLQIATGQRFGSTLVVCRELTLLPRKAGEVRVYRWRCQCDCGEYFLAHTTSLKGGRHDTCHCKDAATSKRCAKCRTEKPAGEFNSSGATPDRLSKWCRDCRRDSHASRSSPPAADGTKSCRECGESKPISAFHARRSKPDGRAAACADCMNRRQRIWNKTNPRQYKEHARRSRIMRRFGITAEAYDELVCGQSCAICGSSTSLCVDHCHASGDIRGVLCNNCNRGIGMLGDDPGRIRAAAAYLEASCTRT